jgi:hypothetical protein
MKLHLVISSSCKTNLDNGEKTSSRNWRKRNQTHNRSRFYYEDALELDRLEICQRGKLKKEEFQRSYFGQFYWWSNLNQASENIKNDAVSFGKIKSFENESTPETVSQVVKGECGRSRSFEGSCYWKRRTEELESKTLTTYYHKVLTSTLKTKLLERKNIQEEINAKYDAELEP